MMGGLDWAALPAVVEYLQVDNIEMVIRGLLHFRNYQTKLREAQQT